MRTVTFSDAGVAKKVNESFVCTWINRSPDFKNREKATELRIKSESYEAFPTKNFCTFFVTPDLRVLSYLSGYYNPAYFTQELSFALDLAGETATASREFDETKRAAYAKLHLARCRERRTQLAEMELLGKPAKLSKDMSGHSEARQRNLRDGLRHLAEVHEDLSDRAGASKHVPFLAEVMTTHLGGNPFTEE